MSVRWRDGRAAQVRPARLSDAPALWALERAVVADGRGMVRTLGDLGTRERYEGRLLARLDPRGAWLVAEADGELVGQAELDRYAPALLAHVGRLSVEVRPDAQGIGVGRALCAAIVEASDARGIVRLELGVRADNARAIALYRSLGFEVESVRSRLVRLPDGSFVDDWCMVRFAN